MANQREIRVKMTTDKMIKTKNIANSNPKNIIMGKKSPIINLKRTPTSNKGSKRISNMKETIIKRSRMARDHCQKRKSITKTTTADLKFRKRALILRRII